MAASTRREVQAAPVRVGALWVRSAGVSGQARGRAGDVPPPVQGERDQSVVLLWTLRPHTKDMVSEKTRLSCSGCQGERKQTGGSEVRPRRLCTSSCSISHEQNLKPLEVSASVSRQIAAQAVHAGLLHTLGFYGRTPEIRP